MSTPRVDRAQVIADAFTDAGVKAYTDVDDVGMHLPCLLVAPPTMTFDVGDGATLDWRLVALTDGPPGARAFADLDALVEQVSALIPAESATPGSYQLTPAADPLPCYVIAYRETL